MFSFLSVVTSYKVNGIFRQWEGYLTAQSNEHLSPAHDLDRASRWDAGESPLLSEVALEGVLIMVFLLEVLSTSNLLSNFQYLSFGPIVMMLQILKLYLFFPTEIWLVCIC